MVLVVLLGASFYVYKTNDVNETYENKETKEVNNNMLSMMLETSAGSGEYQKTTASTWPTEGYVFNETLSKCKNGSNLSWDSDKKQVLFDGNTKDDCYVYFDKTITLVDYVKAQYTGTQGDNNLYLHDSSLTNGAGDNSYRYAGSSDTTNNFVCFGYDSIDGSCPTDNLYRIIGVFDNQVKLIKYDYATPTLLGTDGDYSNIYSNSGMPGTTKGSNILSEIGVYHWNYEANTSKYDNVWSNSLLNKINLNTNYLNNIGANWANRIALHTWKVGGNSLAKIYDVPATTYKNEITSPAENTTYEAKVGLMYVSDYGFAAAASNWSTKLSSYDNKLVTSLNWMYMGLREWVISCASEYSDRTYYINYQGNSDYGYSSYAFAICPTFYLKSNISYLFGSGDILSPIILSD